MTITHINIYIYIYTHVYIHIYIYIYCSLPDVSDASLEPRPEYVFT